MSTAYGDREQQLVRGVVTSVVAKGGDSFQIEVREEGAQYTRKLWTKDANLVQQLHAGGIGQMYDFMCNVSHWKNQSQQNVRSLWIEEIAQYGTLQAPPQVQQPQQGQGLPGQPVGLPQQPALAQGWAPAAGPAPLPGTPAPGLPGSGYPPQSLAPQQPAPQLPPQQADPQWQSIPPVIKEERILRQTAMKCACIMQAYLPEDQRGVGGLEHMAEWFVRYFKGGPQTNPSAQQPHPAPAPTWANGAPVADQAPDWVNQTGAVPQNYDAGAAAQQGAYSGGFPS